MIGIEIENEIGIEIGIGTEIEIGIGFEIETKITDIIIIIENMIGDHKAKNDI